MTLAPERIWDPVNQEFVLKEPLVPANNELIYVTDTGYFEKQILDAGYSAIAELKRATEKFGPFNNPHEGYAVLLEEMDELWDEIKANKGKSPEAKKEAIQIAAMALRYVVDLT